MTEENPSDAMASDALSVSAALALAKTSLETLVLTVVGEVSEVSVKAGYAAAYFSVKDPSSSLPCMMWKNRYDAAGIDLEVGQLVELTGRFTLYAAKGRMSFEVFSITLSGEGRLRMEVARLAKLLQQEGLTSPKRKREIPLWPTTIGLVTSPRGAAVHDVLRTLRRRFPEAEVLLAGVPVEGSKAASALEEGLAKVTGAGAEVVLLVRGGGSFEDFMPFNDEALARAIAHNAVPVVTGIGHEVDTTIADMVSDLRASTPTAAAEAVSPSAESLSSKMENYALSLSTGLGRRLAKTETYLERIASKPLFSDPMMLFGIDAQWLDSTADRLNRALPQRLDTLAQNLGFESSRLKALGPGLLNPWAFAVASSAGRLEDLSPLNVLARGYTMALGAHGTIIKRAKDLKPKDLLDIRFADGLVSAEVLAISKDFKAKG